MRWATGGGGTTSMTAWIVQVDSDSHWEKMTDKRYLGSLDFKSRGDIFRSKAVIILFTLSGLLKIV